MKYALIAFLIAGISTSVSADCFGSYYMSNCYDYNSGNSYDIQRIGNTTYMNGYNSNTGSSWSQETTTYGNRTETTGYDKYGRSWNMSTQRVGNTTWIDGTDSDGNSFSKMCSSIGCF